MESGRTYAGPILLLCANSDQIRMRSRASFTLGMSAGGKGRIGRGGTAPQRPSTSAIAYITRKLPNSLNRLHKGWKA